MQWDTSFLKETDVVYLYGWEDAAYDALKPWLKVNPMHKLIILDDETPTQDDPQIHVCVLGLTMQEELKTHVWESFGKRSVFLHAPQKKQAEVEAIRRQLEDLQQGVELTIGLFRDFGVSFLKNAFANLERLKGVKRGDQLEEKFQGVPAIICGAGPSLDKQLETLKHLHQNALIFGAGSALVPLVKGGVEPHFGVLIDPETPLSQFLEETDASFPILYQLQLSSKCAHNIKGEKLLFGKAEGFPILDWCLDEMGLELPRFHPGWNVATFATHIAYTLGCDPIIFVGMDGCSNDQQSYAKDVQPQRDPMHQEREDSISCVDREGHEVFSRSDFIMGKKWLEELAYSDPKRRFINATEGGLTFEGIPNSPLKEIELSHPHNAKILHEIENGDVLSDYPVKAVLQTIRKSAEKCGEVVEKILDKGTDSLLDWVALEEEPFYQELLEPLWEVWKYPLMNQRESDEKIQKLLFLKKVVATFRDEVFHG